MCISGVNEGYKTSLEVLANHKKKELLVSPYITEIHKV